MSATNQSNIVPKKLLATGASGLLGGAGPSVFIRPRNAVSLGNHSYLARQMHTSRRLGYGRLTSSAAGELRKCSSSRFFANGT